MAANLDAILNALGELAPASSRGQFNQLRRYATAGSRNASILARLLGGRKSLLDQLFTLFRSAGGAGGSGVSPNKLQKARRLLEQAGYDVSARPPRVGRRPTITPPPIQGRITPPPLPGQRGTQTPQQQPEQEPAITRLGRGINAPPLPGEEPGFGQEVATPQSSNVYSFSFKPESRTRGILYVTYKASVLRSSSLTHQGRARKRGGGRQLRGRLGSTVTSQRKNEAGPTYAYFGVPAAVFSRMRQAQSKGKFVWDELRVRGTVYGHQYQYRLVSGQITLQPGVSGVYIPRKATRKGFVERSVAVVGQGRRSFQSSTLEAQPFMESALAGFGSR